MSEPEAPQAPAAAEAPEDVPRPNRARIVTVVAVLAVLALVLWMCPGQQAPAPPPPGGNGDGPSDALPKAPGTAFAVTAAVNDRFIHEPCNRITSGGLFSLGPFLKATEQAAPGVGISMGSITRAPGEVGRRAALFLFEHVLPAMGTRVVCAGEGELGLGAEFLRTVLDRMHSTDQMGLISANATDPQGRPILRGWMLANVALAGRIRGVLIVGAAGESMNEVLVAAGSDVRITDPVPAVAAALEEGLAKAKDLDLPVHTRILLMNGTVDETAAVVAATPGFLFAAAGRGPVLPEADPRLVGTTYVLYPGQGLRHGWRVLADEGAGRPIVMGLSRNGETLLSQPNEASNVMRHYLEVVSPEDFFRVVEDETRARHQGGLFVGAAACVECHPKHVIEHEASPHSRAPRNLMVATSCLSCHTTGAFYQGGWRGPGDESDLKSVSCEACHGPAERHLADTAAPYGRVRPESSCYRCHLPERSPGFDGVEAWRKWGHGAK